MSWGMLQQEVCGDVPSLNDQYERINLNYAKAIMIKRNIKISDPLDVVQQAVNEYGETLNIGWSGGRCSTVVLHMLLKYYPKVKVTFENTLVEFPENIFYVKALTKAWNLNIEQTLPKTTFWKLLPIYGWPQVRGDHRTNKTHNPKCCAELKEKPRYEYYKTHNVQANLCGMRCAESNNRAENVVKRGHIYTIKKPALRIFNPILMWTTKQVTNYIEENNIPFNDVYLTQNRNGCWCCTANKSWREKLQRYNPKLYEFVRQQYWVKPTRKQNQLYRKA
jgi:3'-phosphoadenosine 5'-phosphosulfate sulfotransferase (PAPS reductase)/FAD synthetase